MNIQATITLAEGETSNLTPDSAAAAFLQAAEGDPSKDTCIVYVMNPPVQGQAGVDPTPPA